jgi:hypothetical protein
MCPALLFTSPSLLHTQTHMHPHAPPPHSQPPTLTPTPHSHPPFLPAQPPGADLSNAICDSADFRGASLRGAILRGARLSHALLSHTDLSGRDLVLANLSDAKLTGADLRGADMRGCNLRGANLVQADMTGAILQVRRRKLTPVGLFLERQQSAAAACVNKQSHVITPILCYWPELK